LLSGHLVYEDCSALGRSGSGQSVAVRINDSISLGEAVVSGTFHTDQAFIDGAHQASLVELSSQEDCVLQVRDLRKLLLLLDKLFFSNVEMSPHNCAMLAFTVVCST
jgi:hypothetical protein